MTSLAGAIPYLIVLVLGAALLWGSILSLRGRRWWATVVMTVGSSMQVLGAALTAGGSAWMMSRVMGSMATVSSTGSGSPSAMAASMAPALVLVSIGGLILASGFVVFTAGFIGFCGRYGATENRAVELEILVEQMQGRMER